MNNVKNIAFLSDYVPRQCGIATFTYDSRSAIAEHFAQSECEDDGCALP
jgi:hypothetical protein